MGRLSVLWLALTALFLAPVSCKQRQRTAPTAAPDTSHAPSPNQGVADGSAPSPGQGAGGPVRCQRDTAFPSTVDLPEASAATEVELMPGKRELLIVSDGHGKALAWAIPNGPGRKLKLDLDDSASKDVEGITWHDGKLYTLTSSGAVRVFVPDGQGGLRAQGATYGIEGPSPSCKNLKDSQCGMNYEGLCLRSPKAPGACAGYAAAKAHEQLICVQEIDGKLVTDPKRIFRIPGVHRKSVSDCAFGAQGPGEAALLVTTNLKSGSLTFLLDEASGALTKLEIPGTSSNEAIAVDHEGTLWIFADAHAKHSEALRFPCEGWPSAPRDGGP
jgi:hypothetical protein